MHLLNILRLCNRFYCNKKRGILLKFKDSFSKNVEVQSALRNIYLYSLLSALPMSNLLTSLVPAPIVPRSESLRILPTG
jgi:hypothetical protein